MSGLLALLRVLVRKTAYVFRRRRGNCPELITVLKTPSLVSAHTHCDEGDSDRYHDDTADYGERNSRRNMYPRVGQHLGANEHEHDSKSFVEILKIGQDS